MIHAVPNIKAAEKWALQSEKRATRNKAAKSRLKTLYKGAAAAGEAGAAAPVESAFDKAAARGIIHRNKAARKKSRLAKAMAKAAVAAPAKAKATKSTAKAAAPKRKTATKK
jgi:small subunit ribosomal protein S20